ncbi:ras guanine nucleotide exchange factor domain-containing protein [Aspergillus avenaceus]|uniref:Ras guanine nucleotide exchange factor domain-containing protein n=1 Tax=Aspergillus avenaceus TaxID=36643 RepID=A0A5N6TYM7_ASPAV|nr:ras guanine nucleotide exchange factor domain-containing protein [Aspergillus avenaceus]
MAQATRELPIHTRTQSVQGEVLWFLKLAHDNDIVYETTDPSLLKCGTLAGLVEQLTRHDRLDLVFSETFLITYPTFVSASELFDALLDRFHIEPPSQLGEPEMQIWVAQKQKVVRLRVLNILKAWLERYWMEMHNDATIALLRQMCAKIKSSAAMMEIPTSPQLLSIIEQRIQGQEITKRLATPPNSNIPKPIIPKNMKKLKVLDLDPTELARQLTILEFNHHARIKPAECLNQKWKKRMSNSPEPSTGVNAMILHSNRLSNWVAELVLAQDELKKRVNMIKLFVNAADVCRSLKNYATLMSIISGLGITPVYRLRMTWGLVKPEVRALLEDLKELMSSEKNFIKYRDMLRRTGPPCVPFLGIYLTDLTFIDDGIPDVTNSGMINFTKRTKLAEVLQDIQQYQNMPYNVRPVPELQDFLVRHLRAATEVSDLYNRSLQLEPRGANEPIVVNRSYTATGSHMSSVVIASMAMR